MVLGHNKAIWASSPGLVRDKLIVPTSMFSVGRVKHSVRTRVELQNAHVLPSLIRKFHEAKLNNEPAVTVWGTGSPRREFLHADDLAAACCYLMEHYNQPGLVNIGTGVDVTIAELAMEIKDVVGYKGAVVYDHTKPDGTPRKLMDVSKLSNLGWTSKIELRQGLEMVYSSYGKKSE